MTALTLNPIRVFTKYPVNLFMKSRWFYPVYDATWMGLLLLAIWLLDRADFAGLVPRFEDFRWQHLLALPLVTYVLIMGNVFAHNAAHRNFPKLINRIVGEFVGLLVLTRYASWEIIHLRHHKYSDIPGKDPHDCKSGFWLHFLPYFVVNVERQLQQNFYDYHGGRTTKNIIFEKCRAALSFSTLLVLLYFFYRLLGAPFFVYVFFPAQLITIVHLAHFNWSTHNGFSKTRDFRPINIDRGLYWLGNRIFFGIYYHDNHHKMVKAFNPMHCGEVLEERAERRRLRTSAVSS